MIIIFQIGSLTGNLGKTGLAVVIRKKTTLSKIKPDAGQWRICEEGKYATIAMVCHLINC